MSASDRIEHDTADGTRSAFTVPTEPRDRHSTYLVREARLPIGADYVIELDPGDTVYTVDGKLVRVRESLTIKDIDGNEVFHVQGTVLGGKTVLKVTRQGDGVAVVQKLTPEPDREEYVVELPRSERVDVVGSPADRAYSLSYRDVNVATITHARMALSSGYRVKIAPEQDDSVVLAVTICLDVMSRR